MDSGGSTFYFAYDGLGSVVNLTNASGATQWTYAYLPYGGVRTETKNATQAPANVLRFTGQVLDPTGLYQLRARAYDPATGRFISTDPAPAGPSDPYVSAYAYANNSPMRFVDPSGRESQLPAPAKDYSVGECVGGVFIFFGSEFVGTTFLVGGLLLQGFSITLFGVTLGGATPVSAVGVVAGTIMELAGAAVDLGGVAAISSMCGPDQP